MPAKSRRGSAKDTHYNMALNYIKRVTLGNEIFYMASDGRRLHAVNVEMLGDLLTADYYSIVTCTAQVITLDDPGNSTDIHWPAPPSDFFDHRCYLTTAEAEQIGESDVRPQVDTIGERQSNGRFHDDRVAGMVAAGHIGR